MNKPGEPIERIICDRSIQYPNGLVRDPSPGEKYDHLSQVEYWMIAKTAYDEAMAALDNAHYIQNILKENRDNAKKEIRDLKNIINDFEMREDLLRKEIVELNNAWKSALSTHKDYEK